MWTAVYLNERTRERRGEQRAERKKVSYVSFVSKGKSYAALSPLQISFFFTLSVNEAINPLIIDAPHG